MKKMVFIVEDDPVQQRMLQKHFENIPGDFSVKTFANPDEMVSHLQEKPFAIVLDHYFGTSTEKTGLDYLAIIKKKYSSIPVIYYTSSDDKTLADKAVKAGAFEFIYKDTASFVRLRTTLDKLEEQQKKGKGFFRKLFNR